MNRLLIIGMLVVVVGVLAAASTGFGRGGSAPDSAQKQPRCAVGEKSSAPNELASPANGEDLPGPTIIGCGRSNGEAVQIVAYYLRKSFCFGVYRPVRGSLMGGECKPPGTSWGDRCAEVCIYSVLSADLGSGQRLKRAVVSGGVKPFSEGLSASFGNNGERRSLDLVKAEVSSTSLLEKLHQVEPFSVFGAIVPRCVSPGDVRVRAVVDGRVHTVQGQEALRHPCRAPRLPG